MYQKSKHRSGTLPYIRRQNIEELSKPPPATLSKTRAIANILTRFEQELHQFDIPYYVISGSHRDIPADGARVHIYSNWPKELLRLWEEKRGFALDPIVQFGRTASGPYFWSDAVKNISKNAAHLFDIANSFGLKEGYVVPHRTAAGNLGGGVSIGGPVFPYSKAELEPIHQICKQVLVDLNDLIHEIEPIPLGLSNQEREVLQCAARGESIFATSQILHISVSAVKDAQTRARKKLNAKNTTHACVIATRINLI